MKNKVLITVDLSESTSDIIKKGIDFAKKMDAHVILCTIIPIYIDYLQTQVVMVPTQLDEVYAVQKEHAMKVFDSIKAEHPGILFETFIEIGNPKFDIIDKANKDKVNYIVVGTHGRTGLKHTIMGSTAEYIIRHATMPVLVVPLNRKEH